MLKKLNCIQLIDDDESTNRFHEIIIQQIGFKGTIIKSKNGKVALEQLVNNDNNLKPDLIFLDLNMPVMDGFRFLQLFTNSKEFQENKPKIVVLTTSLIPEEKIRAIENEYTTLFINKPMTKKNLINVLESI